MIHRPLRFADDTRGSVLLPSLSMAAVLVLGVMYISQTAQDVLGRIAAQTQADSAALEGAVWHAQGMNLLVTLNIVMACIFAVFLAIRLVVLGLTLLLAVVVIGSALLSIISFGGAAAAGAQLAQLIGRALYQMQRTERQVAKPVMNALKVTTGAERVVSAAVPWVAAALPVSRLSGNEGALVFSVAMIPNVLEQWVKDAPVTPKIPSKTPVVGGLKPRTQLPARMGNFANLGTSNKPDAKPAGRHRADKGKLIGRMVGLAQSKGRKASNKGAGASNSGAAKVLDVLSGSLPAQDEDIFMVCSRSAEGVAALVTKILAGPLKLDGASVESFNSTFGKTIGSIPTVACMPMEQLSGSLQDQVTAQVGAKCKEEKEAWQNAPQESDEAKHRKKPWTKGQQLECEKKHKDAATKALGKGRGADGKDVDLSKDQAAQEDIKTAALWGLTLEPKESPLLHVWSINPSERWPYFPGDAEAEFRHTCDTPKDKDGRSCADNSLWRYGWYAKQVPLRPLEHEFAIHVSDMAQGWANRAIGKAIQGVIGRVAAFLPSRLNQTGTPGLPAGSPGTGKHGAAPPTIADLFNRQLSGVRHPELGNGYWNRKLVGPMLGNWTGGKLYDLKQWIFH